MTANQSYKRLKRKLLERGWNLRQFAIRNGYKVATVYDAARGSREGVLSVKIRRELEELAYAE